MTVYSGLYLVSLRCFNPHTHEGCDDRRIHVCLIDGVSIHTPTKGVTAGVKQLAADIKVSIHTPTKGVTNNDMTCAMISGVSIHTPTKGVTYTVLA